MSANTNSYRYYKILGVSGTLSGGNYIYQFDFKVGSTNSLFYRQSYITNGTTANGIIVNQLNGGTFGIGEDNAVAKLAVRGSTSIGSSAYSGINPPLNGLMVEGNVGIGTTVVSAPLHVQKATAGALGAEILRVSYDASNYFSTYTSFVGNVTLDAVGSASLITFPDKVGCSVTAPSSALHTTALATAITTKSANYTLTTADYAVIFDGTSLTATFPAASTCPGRIYVVVNRNATALTTSVAYQTLATGVTSTTITAATSAVLQSNGTSYYKLN
jgi:hypothetical protein